MNNMEASSRKIRDWVVGEMGDITTVVLTDETLCENIGGPLELRDMDL